MNKISTIRRSDSTVFVYENVKDRNYEYIIKWNNFQDKSNPNSYPESDQKYKNDSPKIYKKILYKRYQDNRNTKSWSFPVKYDREQRKLRQIQIWRKENININTKSDLHFTDVRYILLLTPMWWSAEYIYINYVLAKRN